MQQNVRTKSLSADKFLTVSINLINKALLEAGRSEAKRLFRGLEEGKHMPLTHLQMEDKSLVRFDLALNAKQYQGDLNFGKFRLGVTLLVANAAEALRAPEKIRTYRNEHDPDSVLFGVTAATAEDGKPSVLVLGADSRRGEASVLLQLSYIDYQQFEDQLKAAADQAQA